MKKTFRIAAVFLAVCTLLCVFPVTAHADYFTDFNQSGNIISWNYEKNGPQTSTFSFTGLWENGAPFLSREYLSRYKEYFSITWTEDWNFEENVTRGSVSLDLQEMLEYFSARSDEPIEAGTYAITIVQGSTLHPTASRSFAFKYAPRPEGLHGVRVDGGSATPSLGKPGTLVALKASSKPGYTFDHWQIDEGDATLDEPGKSMTGLTIGTTDVKVTAVYTMTGTLHSVTVTGGNAYCSPDTAFAGEWITLGVPDDDWDRFVRWEVVSGGMKIYDPNDSNTHFTMPDNDVVIRAVYDDDFYTEHSVTVIGGKANRVSAIYGEEVVIQADHNPGESFYGWTVVSGGVTIENTANPLSRFYMGMDDVVIRANLSKDAPDSPFVDVKKDDYFFDAVIWAVGHDPVITKGTDETHFSPNASCTRAQAVTFLWRAAGSPEPKATDNPFDDVKETDYFYKAVLWAVEEGITKGTGAAAFSPNSTCTRGQIVTFLHRAQGSPEPGTTDNPFGDVTEADYYYSAVLWAVGNDITKGTSATAFSPNSTCTRGQIVTFLYRAMK